LARLEGIEEQIEDLEGCEWDCGRIDKYRLEGEIVDE